MNIGERACKAITALRGNPDFAEFVDALGDEAQKFVFRANSSTLELRIDATAYARGVFDIWTAIAAQHQNQKPQQVKLPPKKAGDA